MPDFERRSSASFISSNEGGTPASFSRSLMKRRSSYCLRVSISTSSPVVSCASQRSEAAVAGQAFDVLKAGVRITPSCVVEPPTLETNHERTLYVPYVFRNTLISGEQARFGADDATWTRLRRGYSGSRRSSQTESAGAGGAN